MGATMVNIVSRFGSKLVCHGSVYCVAFRLFRRLPVQGVYPIAF